MEITPTTDDITAVTPRKPGDVFLSVHGANRRVPTRWFEGADDVLVDIDLALCAGRDAVGPRNDMVWVELHIVGRPLFATRTLHLDGDQVVDGGWNVWDGDDFLGRRTLPDLLALVAGVR